MIKRLFQKLSGSAQPSAKPQAKPAPKSGQAKAQNNQPKPGNKPQGGNKKRNNRANKKKPQQPAWSLEQFQVPELEGKTRFHDFDLTEQLMHGIADSGFEYCTPIQAQSLPIALKGHDVIGKAQTGTGKTAAFLIAAINDLMTRPLEGERYIGEPRAVVIAPTRELVIQIGKDAQALCKHTGLHVATLIGGMDYAKQLDQITHNVVDIVVATPGRLIDFMQRGDLQLNLVEVLVIDEADRMLDMGFIPQVRRIVRATPHKENRQTLLFSATFTDDILNLSQQWTFEPKTVEIEAEKVTTDNVEQFLYAVPESDKYAVLKAILKQDEVDSAIIFANRRDQTRRLHEKLQKAGFKVGMLSGEVGQNKRTKTLEDFRHGKLKVMVATDVAGRGIHIDGISHVVNYYLPEDPEDYVHRIGRTGRAGAKGVSISLIGEEDGFNLLPLEDLLGKKLKTQMPPESLYQF